MKRAKAIAYLTHLLFLSAAYDAAEAQRLITPADTIRFAAVSDPQVSPDGRWVVYSVSTSEGSSTASTLWLVSIEQLPFRPRIGRVIGAAAGDSRPLLPPGWNATSPRWSPDGKRIAFLSTQEKQTGIWTVTLADRQPHLVATTRQTNFFITYAGEALAWAPDSRRLAFVSASEDENWESTATDHNIDPRVIDRIQYKSRTSFSDRARTHVWVAEVDSDRPPRQLTTEQYYDHAITWSPGGDEIAFVSNREPDPDANNNSDIFAVNMDGRVRQITSTRGCEYEPAWSPDGRWIAYTATKRDITTIDSVAEDTHVWLVGSGGGAGRELTSRQDRRARNPHWTADSRTILYTAGDRGETLLYRIGIEDGQARELFGERRNPHLRADIFAGVAVAQPFQVTGYSVSQSSPGQVMAFVRSDALHPGEVWMASSGAEGIWAVRGRVSAQNDALLRSLTLAEPAEFTFRSFDGTPIQGWLMKPADFHENRQYPLILSIHGGPHGMYGYGFNPAFQTYVASGYGVLYMNPRGSSGYGQRFSDGTLKEWGGGDFRDLMAGVDEALRGNAWIDPNRLGVTGGSYGGFMTNWVITQTPRFKAAVAVASVSDLVSFYATSLYQDLVHAEFGGYPWDDYDLLWRWSPIRYVRNAQTPTLFIHGEQDNDVHITQAEEMYMALKRRGIETVFVRYPREGHGFHEPGHRVDSLERTIAWLDRFLK